MSKQLNPVVNVSLSRRSLLAALPALGCITHTFAQEPAAITVRKINCFEIRVSDPSRTMAFYQDLFGMPVQSRFGERYCMRIGQSSQFMIVRPLEVGEAPAITYLGYSVENFDVQTQQNALLSKGFTTIEPPAISAPGIDFAMSTWVRMRGDTPELFFADARGLIVQLSDLENCGGNGALGSVCGALEAAPIGLFKLSEINHFTVFGNDGAGANTFYQEIFGLSVQAHQGPTSPVTGIGDGKQFVMYAGPFAGAENVPASINHGCFNMEGFVVDDILAKLTTYGLTARGDGEVGPMMHYVSQRQPARGGAEGGTPEVYFTDPDGLLMQLQDITYCGGGGYLGNECEQA